MKKFFRPVLSSLVLLSLATTGCQRAEPRATETPITAASSSPILVPEVQLTPGQVKEGVGLTEISLGQSKGEVSKALGAPEEVDSNEFAPGQTYALYYSKGIELTFADDKLEVITLHSPDPKWKAYTGATSHGVGVGSSAEDIVQALGEPTAESTRALRYPKLGLWFRLDGDRGTTDRPVRAETLQVMKPE